MKGLGVSLFNSTLKEQVWNNTMNFHKIKWNFYNFNNFSIGISEILQHLISELIYVESDKNVKYFEMGYPSKRQSFFFLQYKLPVCTSAIQSEFVIRSRHSI